MCAQDFLKHTQTLELFSKRVQALSVGLIHRKRKVLSEDSLETRGNY